MLTRAGGLSSAPTLVRPPRLLDVAEAGERVGRLGMLWSRWRPRRLSRSICCAGSSSSSYSHNSADRRKRDFMHKTGRSAFWLLQRVEHAVIKVHVDALLFVIEAQLRMRRSAKNQKGDHRQRPKDSARYQTTGIPGERKAKDCTDQPGSNH